MAGKAAPWLVLLLLVGGSADALPLNPSKDPTRLPIAPIEAAAPHGAAITDLPYPFIPETVTAAKVNVDASLVTHWNGADQDNIIVDIAGSGPVHWSLSRWNEGDFAVRLQPRHPYAQSAFGVAPGPQGFSTSNPKDFAAQAWRPHRDRGVTLASVAQNGQQWNDGQPRFFGTVAASTDSSGYGYSMIDGTFGKEDPSLDICLGAAGKRDEVNIDFGVAWFPYAQGWIGGFVEAPASPGAEATWQGAGSHSANLAGAAREVVTWTDKGARLRLPAVSPREDGMLFAISTDPGQKNSEINIVSVIQQDTEWVVQQHEDNEVDVTKLADQKEWMFAFLYVPYTAGNLFGGHVMGSSGKFIVQAGQVDCQRKGPGQYELSIDNRQMTERDGILLLQSAQEDNRHSGYATTAFLSYNYTGSGTLLVESRQYIGGASPQDCPLADSDFYFAWVDFHAPLTPKPSAKAEGFAAAAEAVAKGRGGFGVGFFIGILVTGVMVCTTWVVLKSVYDRRPRGGALAVPLSEIVCDELEQDLLPSADYRLHDEEDEELASRQP